MSRNINIGESPTIWEKPMAIIRDVIFIILFLATTIGWIRASAINRTKLEKQVEVLTGAVNENTKQLEKINDILAAQQNLNGQIIQYMKMDNHN